MKRTSFGDYFCSVQSDLRVYNTHSSDSGGSSVSHAEARGEGAVGGGGMWG